MIVNQKDLYCSGAIKNPLSKKSKLNGVSYGMSEAGYDIRIKQDIYFTPAMYHFSGSLLRPPCVLINGTKVSNGNFALASAIEEFDMPDNLVGVVHDKSTWARQGLSVFNTVIEPGWKGFLTLELVFHGNKPLFIPAGSGIAQVLFHQIVQPVEYGGKYQNQADEPVTSVFE